MSNVDPQRRLHFSNVFDTYLSSNPPHVGNKRKKKTSGTKKKLCIGKRWNKQRRRLARDDAVVQPWNLTDTHTHTKILIGVSISFASGLPGVCVCVCVYFRVTRQLEQHEPPAHPFFPSLSFFFFLTFFLLLGRCRPTLRPVDRSGSEEAHSFEASYIHLLYVTYIYIYI